MAKKKLRVAFIGCGGIAGRHAKAMLPDRRVEITHLVDTSKKSLKRFKERFPDLADLPEYADYRDVLGEVDAVSINTPHTLHYRQVMDSLDRGLHVLCEKPLACTAVRARKIVEKVRQTRRKLQIAYQRRAMPQFRYVREQIRSRAIGRLCYVSVTLCQPWLAGTRGTWRRDPALSGGGQLNDSGSHIMDSLQWFVGRKPLYVSSFSHNRGTKVDIDSTVQIEFAQGVLASVVIIATAMPFDERWIIAGSEATLIVEGGVLKRVVDKYGPAVEVKIPKRKAMDITRNWVDAIYGKAKLLSPARGVLDVVRITDAAWKSAARGGKPVKL